MKRTDIIRCHYREMNEFTRFVYQNSTCPDKVQLQKSLGEYIRRKRSLIRENYRNDPLSEPLTAVFRVRYDEDGDGYTEYGVLPEDGDTSDEEIRDYMDDYIRLPEINSPYDCTGKPFTMRLAWKRTPSGIAVIHRVCLDI